MVDFNKKLKMRNGNEIVSIKFNPRETCITVKHIDKNNVSDETHHYYTGDFHNHQHSHDLIECDDDEPYNPYRRNRCIGELQDIIESKDMEVEALNKKLINSKINTKKDMDNYLQGRHYNTASAAYGKEIKNLKEQLKNKHTGSSSDDILTKDEAQDFLEAISNAKDKESYFRDLFTKEQAKIMKLTAQLKDRNKEKFDILDILDITKFELQTYKNLAFKLSKGDDNE